MTLFARPKNTTDPRKMPIGPADVNNWFRYSPDQIRIMRGMFDGRVTPLRYDKMVEDREVPSWVTIHGGVDEASRVLGEQIMDGTFLLTVDHVNVRIGGVRVDTTRKGYMGYKTIGKVEALIREMPSRFTYSDIQVAKVEGFARNMAKHSIYNALYLHVIADNLEYIPNPHNPTNPSFRKLTSYLEAPTL
tara:strand:+ start:135 stop:704 length:570 start_codon:yes stop_codon:yes gene_type:complete